MATSSAISGAANGTQLRSKQFALKTEDFIKMMVTQLQNQDPMEPAKNQELLAQMSQIGQLESSHQLQASLQGMVKQNQIGSAGNLIGKEVAGVTAFGDEVSGVVTMVRVRGDQIELELDNGHAVPLSNVLAVAGQPLAWQ